MYPYRDHKIPKANFNNDDRFFPFLFPFIGGALIGGAAVGLSRPRPVYVNPAPYGGYGYPYSGYGYPYGYNYGNYGYYNYR